MRRGLCAVREIRSPAFCPLLTANVVYQRTAGGRLGVQFLAVGDDFRFGAVRAGDFFVITEGGGG